MDQDVRRTSPIPSLIGISNDAEFCTAIGAAIQRDRIRKYSLDESSSLSKAANPGKLKRYKECITWYRALKNHLLTILGQNRVPLRYVIRYSGGTRLHHRVATILRL